MGHPQQGDPQRYRRALYTFWKRSIPYPTFITFDAPTREMCSKRRMPSNTPIQALAILNDPAFHEAEGTRPPHEKRRRLRSLRRNSPSAIATPPPAPSTPPASPNSPTSQLPEETYESDPTLMHGLAASPTDRPHRSRLRPPQPRRNVIALKFRPPTRVLPLLTDHSALLTQMDIRKPFRPKTFSTPPAVSSSAIAPPGSAACGSHQGLAKPPDRSRFPTIPPARSPACRPASRPRRNGSSTSTWSARPPSSNSSTTNRS